MGQRKIFYNFIAFCLTFPNKTVFVTTTRMESENYYRNTERQTDNKTLIYRQSNTWLNLLCAEAKDTFSIFPPYLNNVRTNTQN